MALWASDPFHGGGAILNAAQTTLSATPRLAGATLR